MPTDTPIVPADRIEVLHRDDHILIVNKPAGLLSVPGIGVANADCLVSRLAVLFPDTPPLIVHRLDQATSGVMLLAFDADSHRELSRQFEKREVEKEYIAIVAGHVIDDEGVIDQPMRKDMNPANKPRHIIDPVQGKQALTKWKVIERSYLSAEAGPDERSEEDPDRNLQITRLSLHPKTGRSHQLRVHMQSINHPILGDDLYAPPEIAEATPRLMLHAQYISIKKPATGVRMQFTAPAPF